MVSLTDAYIKVFSDVYPGCYSETAIEDDGGYVFFPKPNDVPKGEKVYTGTVYPYVSKFTGAVSDFDMMTRTLYNPKRINLEIKEMRDSK